MNLSDYKIILASNSPRRKELLSGVDLNFEVITLPNIDESYPPNMPSKQVAAYIAKKKADTYLKSLSADVVLITADTIVLLEDEVFGKPRNKNEAKQMLQKLSGETHFVITGVCITTIDKQKVFDTISEVRFAQLSESEIDYYVNNYNPLDKAGAYGIQEWIGYVGVEYIAGSYFNIMGLPIQRLYQELKQF